MTISSLPNTPPPPYNSSHSIFPHTLWTQNTHWEQFIGNINITLKYYVINYCGVFKGGGALQHLILSLLKKYVLLCHSIWHWLYIILIEETSRGIINSALSYFIEKRYKNIYNYIIISGFKNIFRSPWPLLFGNLRYSVEMCMLSHYNMESPTSLTSNLDGSKIFLTYLSKFLNILTVSLFAVRWKANDIWWLSNTALLWDKKNK